MDKFISEVEAYASEVGLSPSTIVQRAKAGGGNTWKRWQNGGACSLDTADRVRAYMAANPARAKAQDGEAA